MLGILDGTGLELDSPVTQIDAAGGYEGASRISRELASWNPPIQSPDQQINDDKQLLDARSRDIVANDGYMAGAIDIHKDSIVGGQYMLNSKPNWRALGQTPEWAEAFQLEVEAKFTLWAESLNNYPDAAAMNNFTGLVRLAVGTFALTGEVLATVEYLRQPGRPYKTAVQMIDLDRLSNPNGAADTQFLRRGVKRNIYGAAESYYIQTAHPGTFYVGQESYTWKEVPAKKPWGRAQVIHIIEQNRPDQTRGIAGFVSVLKQMKMTQKFQDITLQAAVLNATFAATIESELPPETVFGSLGMGGADDVAANFLAQVAKYTGSSRNMTIDGVRIPHLYPNTKLNLLTPGQPGGVGDRFEQSLLRHTAAALGLSYEQFSRDYTQTNYSSARASMNETWKFMQGRKTMVADRFASNIFALWFEEALNAGDITTITRDMPNFYLGTNREAYLACSWVGASRGQIDEKKETDAAVARILGGISTYEKECARLGDDFREVFAQRAREMKMMQKLGLSPAEAPAKSKARKDKKQKDTADTPDETDAADDTAAA